MRLLRVLVVLSFVVSIGYAEETTVDVDETQEVAQTESGALPDVESITIVRSDRSREKSQGIGLTPVLGFSGHTGRWNRVANEGPSFGLIVDFPISSDLVSLEVEGYFDSARFQPFAFGPEKSFSRFGLGANIKVAPRVGVFRPYGAFGLHSLYYDNIRNAATGLRPYNRWVGAVQLAAGGEIWLSESIGFGLRGAYILPFINKAQEIPALGFNPFYPSTEAGLVNSSYYRFLGTFTVRID